LGLRDFSGTYWEGGVYNSSFTEITVVDHDSVKIENVECGKRSSRGTDWDFVVDGDGNVTKIGPNVIDIRNDGRYKKIADKFPLGRNPRQATPEERKRTFDVIDQVLSNIDSELSNFFGDIDSSGDNGFDTDGDGIGSDGSGSGGGFDGRADLGL
jgi:hypothetical protein